MRITALWKQHGNTRLKRPPHFISSFSEVPSSFNWSIYIPSQNSVKQQKRVNGVDRRQDDKRKVCGIESAWRENASSQEFREKTKSDWPETLLLKTGHIFERKTEKKRERIWLPEGGTFNIWTQYFSPLPDSSLRRHVSTSNSNLLSWTTLAEGNAPFMCPLRYRLGMR